MAGLLNPLLRCKDYSILYARGTLLRPVNRTFISKWLYPTTERLIYSYIYIRRIWRYQRGNQNPYIVEQTTQWSKERVQRDKQQSTQHTYKSKDRVRRSPLNTGGELRSSGRVNSSCSPCDTRRVNLLTNPVKGTYSINHPVIICINP